MARSMYTKYKVIVERMGFRQLDVYRYRDKDVVRIQRVADGKVFVVELPRHREEMSLEEYERVIKSSLSRSR